MKSNFKETLFILLFGITVIFQACTTGDETNVQSPSPIKKTSLKSKTTEIQTKDIPAGITPLKYHDKAELDKIIKNLDNSAPLKVCNLSQDKFKYQSPRFKSKYNEDYHFFTFSIIEKVGFMRYGDRVTFDVYLQGLHPGIEISGVRGSYRWHDNKYLDYDLSYSLDAYIQSEVTGKWVLHSSLFNTTELNINIYN